MDELLDFDSDDFLRPASPAPKKRKKVIGLDDLLTDYYKEQNRLLEKETKKKKKPKRAYNSDDDEDGREAKLCKYVDECQEKMRQIGGEDEISLWGLQVFKNQKVLPPVVSPEVASCLLLKFFVDHEFNSLVGLNPETGGSFLEGLLTNGWLLKLVQSSGHVDECIAKWALNLMLYSSKETLRSMACDFWCSLLLLKNEGDSISVNIDWLPSYSEVRGALESYGFVSGASDKYSSNVEIVHEDSERVGPPQNIRNWIKFVTACCQVRNTHTIFSTQEAEELMVMVICLLLDRQLLGLSLILYDCMLSLLNFFTDEEWCSSSEKVAESLARRVPLDINCLRTVESMSGVCARCKHLRSAIAFRFLRSCFDNRVADAEEVLRSLISINVKEKSCDLFKMYIYLVLSENWLSSNPILEEKPLINEMWGVYLRNCSCQITNTDLRSYASKVRNKASYLLQGNVAK